MDTSKEYIEMCQKAKCIQKIRHSQGYWEAGDCYANILWNNDYNVHWVDGGLGADIHMGLIWIPRLDQLAKLIITWNKDMSSTFFQHIAVNSKYRSIPERGYDSLEKHLLVFLMEDLYRKRWVEQDKEWRVTDKDDHNK